MAISAWTDRAGLRTGLCAGHHTERTRFHEWLDGSWAVPFSYPRDFTPVCTTELGVVARLGPEWRRRDVKVIGLSVDSSERHAAWEAGIAKTQGEG